MKSLIKFIIVVILLYTTGCNSENITTDSTNPAERISKVYERRQKLDFYYRFYEPSQSEVNVVGVYDDPTTDIKAINKLEDLVNDKSVSNERIIDFINTLKTVSTESHTYRAALAAYAYRHLESPFANPEKSDQEKLLNCFMTLAKVPYSDILLMTKLYKSCEPELSKAEITSFKEQYTLMLNRVRKSTESAKKEMAEMIQKKSNMGNYNIEHLHFEYQRIEKYTEDLAKAELLLKK
jgi:hypothetical protein